MKDMILNRSQPILPENKTKKQYHYIQRLKNLKSVNRIERPNMLKNSTPIHCEQQGRKDAIITKLLSKVFKPKTQLPSPERHLPQSIPYKFKHKLVIKENRRRLIDHTKIYSSSQQDRLKFNLREKFDEIIMNQHNSSLKDTHKKRAERNEDLRDDSQIVTTHSGIWAGLKTQENFISDKSTSYGFIRKLTGLSKSKYTDHYNSRFEENSQTPTKTDKSLVLIDNLSNSKNTDLAEVHKILEKIEQTELKNKNGYYRNRQTRTPGLSGNEKKDTNQVKH